MPQTLRLQRILTAPPSRVFSALTIPEALAKWMAPHGFYATILEWGGNVGDTYKMSFTNLGTGTAHSFGGKVEALDAPNRLVITDAFDDPNMAGTMTTTYELRECMGGTELTMTQEGLPDEMPIEVATMGWQESLQLLQLLVAPDIPDAGVPVEGDA